jgi:Brp/Blh family beta-carotene 15,15'-monooxygenase
MSKLYKFAVIFSFFALWINVYFSKTYQQIAGFVVIFLFGILHGANDLALYAKIDSKTTNKSFKKIVFYYVLIIIFGILLFYCVPTLALLLFLIFSGYHFGEQHWNYLKKSGSQISTIIFQTIYGLFIFSMLFYFHESEVKLIVSKIIHYSISDINFTGITIVLGIALMLSSIDMYRKFITFKNQILINIFYLMVYAIIFKTADLICAFAIYFVVWNSIP